MADTEEEVGTGIAGRATSRRSFLVKSAVVASAAVWVPPVVESFTSPAAAQSVAFSCSWAYVFWYDTEGGAGSQLYVTGFTNATGSKCGNNGSNPSHGTITLTCDGYAVSFPEFTGPPPPFAYTYGKTSGTTDYVGSPQCASDVTDVGNVVTGSNQVTLVGAVYFGGATGLATVCAASNTVTLPVSC